MVSQHQEEIEKLKAGQRHVSEEMKKVLMSRDQDMTLIQDLREDVDKIKTTQLLMEGDIKKLKESLALMKKLEEDLKKLREDIAKWKEESSKEISQQIEALRQETKRELQKMGEQQERRNAMLEQMLNETADQLNEQDQELRQQMEAKFLEIQKDFEKLNFTSKSLQKDSQQKQRDIEMLFQSLEKLQKEKADQQDMLAAMDMVQSRGASVPAQGLPGRVTNAPCPWGLGARTGVGRENFLSSGGPSPSRWWDQAHQADGANGATAA
ncbi:glutamine-rich protein 2-like [Passer domesticus]|uniref:glutamine-rich protein 2-like n=1 Tax=Passer domesticus TaxID=48849 RepID=UPI0030FE3499